MRSSSFHRIARTAILGTALVAGVAVASGCSGDASQVRGDDGGAIDQATGIRQIRREAHFALGGLPAGHYQLELGSRTYDLSEHTAASRSQLRSSLNVSHFVSGASFSREAPQSYRVVRVGADGSRTMVLAGIHLPPKAGAADPLVVTMADAAKFLVFQDPSLMTIDGESAARVLAHIEKSPDYARLVESIETFGKETSIHDQDVDFTSGWAVTVVSKDSAGNPLTVTSPITKQTTTATHWVTAGSPEYYKEGFNDIYTQVGGSKVRVTTPYELAAIVRKEARALVRDDQQLANKMFVQQTDTTVRVMPHATTLGAPEGQIAYALDDTQFKGDRRIAIVKSEGRKITFSVENNQWRRQGVLVRFRDQAGNLIAKSDLAKEELPESEAYGWFNGSMKYSTLLDIVDGRFTVLGVPFTAETKREFTVELPEKASSFEINIASAGMKHGETPAYLNGGEPERIGSLPGGVQTVLLDVALPLMALAVGTGAEKLIKSPIVGALAGAGLEVGVSLIMNTAGTASGQSPFTREYAAELLTEVITKTPGLAVALIEWAGEEAGEKAIESAFGGIGLVIEAIEALGTLAQVAETVGTIANNSEFTYDRVAASETLKVRITPKEDPTTHAPGYFSPAAKKVVTTAYYGHSTVPTVKEQAIDWSGNGPKEIVVALPQQPVGGEVRVKVALESDNGWTAAEGELETKNEPNAQNEVVVPIAVDMNPVPIDAHTQYGRDRVLAYANGQRTWQTSNLPPVVTGPQVCNTGDSSRPWLCGGSSMTFNSAGMLGYAWNGSGSELRTCGGATNVRGSMAQTINVNPSYGGPDAISKRLSCASESQVFLAFDPTGSPSGGKHVLVEQIEGKYEVFGIDIGTSGNLDPADKSTSLGHFRSQHLDEITLNPATGMLLGLDKSEGVVEVLKLAPAPMPRGTAPTATAVGGAGKSIGRLHDATSLAFLPAGAGFLVLEAGSSDGPARVQAFTFDGASVPRFAGQASFALETEAGAVTYTDMKIDPTEGYVYVGSYVGANPTPADYRLDIYKMTDGSHVSRTTGVVASKMAIDRWRDLYTLDYANLAGATWPEPSVTEWTAPGSLEPAQR